MARKVRLSNRIKALLPWSVNGTLRPGEEEAVQTWLQQDADGRAELASWRRLHSLVAAQATLAPSSQVWQQVLAQARLGGARSGGSARGRLTWGLGAALGALLLLWVLLQPGVRLEWSVQGGPVTAFRLYRAPLGSAQFNFVAEVPASGQRQYRFQDGFLLPGQSYVYHIEALSAGGQPAARRAIVVAAQAALPLQMAIVALSLIAGLAAGILRHPVGLASCRLR